MRILNQKIIDFMRSYLKRTDAVPSNEDELYIFIAMYVTGMRKEAKLTQEKAGALLGYTQETISRMEKGNIKLSPFDLFRICSEYMNIIMTKEYSDPDIKEFATSYVKRGNLIKQSAEANRYNDSSMSVEEKYYQVLKNDEIFARTTAKLTQAKVAELTGITRSKIAAIETGDRKPTLYESLVLSRTYFSIILNKIESGELKYFKSIPTPPLDEQVFPDYLHKKRYLILSIEC